MSEVGVAPLLLSALLTSSAAPTLGLINRYDSSAANRTPTLPPITGLRAGAYLVVRKQDSTTRTVTVSTTAGDSFDDGSTVFVLSGAGEQQAVQVVSVAGVNRWTKIGGGGGGGGGGALDADLQAIAALIPAVNDFLQYESTGWTNKTVAQVLAELGLDNVSNTSDTTKWAAQKTLSNTRFVPRYTSIASSATPAINTDLWDVFGVTALTVNITSMSSSLSGTPNPEEELRIFFIGTAARTISWGTSFEDGPQALPTTTVTTQRLDTLFYRNGVTNKWRCYAANSA